GRFSPTLRSTPHRSAPRITGRRSCETRRKPSSPPTSSTMPSGGLCRVGGWGRGFDLASVGAGQVVVGIVVRLGPMVARVRADALLSAIERGDQYGSFITSPGDGAIGGVRIGLSG